MEKSFTAYDFILNSYFVSKPISPQILIKIDPWEPELILHFGKKIIKIVRTKQLCPSDQYVHK